VPFKKLGSIFPVALETTTIFEVLDEVLEAAEDGMKYGVVEAYPAAMLAIEAVRPIPVTTFVEIGAPAIETPST
jgi:hypothetical protein